MTTLEKIISAIDDATTLPIKPFGTTNIEECICYSFSSQRDDGAVARFQLEIRIICKDLINLYENEGKIKSALITVGDTVKINGINSIEQNGGGILKDFETGTIQSILYFDIIKKSEV